MRSPCAKLIRRMMPKMSPMPSAVSANRLPRLSASTMFWMTSCTRHGLPCVAATLGAGPGASSRSMTPPWPAVKDGARPAADAAGRGGGRLVLLEDQLERRRLGQLDQVDEVALAVLDPHHRLRPHRVD